MTPPQFSAGGQHPPAPRRTREEINKLFDQIEAALREGRITRDEYQYYLKHEFEGKDRAELLRELQEEEQVAHNKQHVRSKTPTPITLILIIGIMLGLLTIGFFGNGITGFATYKETSVPADGLTFTGSANITLNITNTTSFSISGSLSGGAGSVTLLVGTKPYTLWSGEPSPPPFTVTTPYESYARNASINASWEPANETNVTLWLTTPAGTRTPFTNGDRINEPGEYTLDALFPTAKASTTFIVRNDTNTSRNTPRPARSAVVQFTNACGEACSLNETGNETLTLAVELEDGATLTITGITVTQPRANTAPVMTTPLGDVALSVGESVSINLDEHFSDADGDVLLYDVLHVQGATMTIEGSTLTITGNTAGGGTTRVYASDAETLTESNPFTINITGNATDTTGATSPAGQNITSKNTTNVTGANATRANLSKAGTNKGAQGGGLGARQPASPAGFDCANPDPNKRPVECLQRRAAEYFQPQELYLTTPSRKAIARFTPIGNMVITGDIIEGSTGTPGKDDYKIGYEDVFGDYHATVWVESATGDLHLRGKLHEEQINNVPAPGSFVLRNKRGIVVAWADQRRGDLYVRGMVVQRRKVK